MQFQLRQVSKLIAYEQAGHESRGSCGVALCHGGEAVYLNPLPQLFLGDIGRHGVARDERYRIGKKLLH